MNSINKFQTEPFIDALKAFFDELNVPIHYLADEHTSAEQILGDKYKPDNEAHLLINKVYALGIVDDAVFKQTDNDLFEIEKRFKKITDVKKLEDDYDGLLIFGIELVNQTNGLPPTRSQLAEITRAFNRAFPYTPVTVVFKYGNSHHNYISLANSERVKYKQAWREGEKVGKVVLVQNIDIQKPHAGHLRILLDLTKPNEAQSFKDLLRHWNQVLDVSILNKKFFQDLSNWYFWAMENVSFPNDLEQKKDVQNATNLIRLITRVVFIWFIKEKSLVPDNLFDQKYLDTILKDFNKNPKSKNYYNAILQNLFFGTLNQRMKERKFAKDGEYHKNKEEYGVKNLFRYADLFNISEDEAMQLFESVPFLNGGLFDCLDKPTEAGTTVYVDGFSRNSKKQASVPDFIFFSEEKDVDLNETFGTKNKKYKAKGLINLLESYKFTVEENTPIEEEVALDPELLGKVFENLLASYNPETKATARKQTGSFYTPREIVNYMVDESLVEYIKQNVRSESEAFEINLRDLISYSETPNPFDETATKTLIEALNNCKILDPACGSGAYPMGILQKMVHLLQKLDPDNRLWKDLQRKKAIQETEAAFEIGNKDERDSRLKEISDVFENNASDYGRKLYLIENCIYGIDIQPIAVQISKLRFFISLIIDQNKHAENDNFGIRSLPNLETKFVAANTLIGLDKPKQGTLRNLKIEEKESELKDLRHKYFTANTRKVKLEYQKQDKTLRQEIATMLEYDGWKTAVANQIVAFDPYDQNTSAAWFDPEWMFGLKAKNRSNEDIEILNAQIKAINAQIDAINTAFKLNTTAKLINLKLAAANIQSNIIIQEIKIIKTKIDLLYGSIPNQVRSIVSEPQNIEYQISALNTKIKYINDEIEAILKTLASDNDRGVFDIVIGNPPYVEARKLKEVSPMLKKSYSTYSGTADLYVYFYEHGVTLLKNNGTLIFITSNKFIKTSYGENLRGYFINFRINEIIDFTKVHVFQALVSSCIFSISKNSSSSNKIKIAFADDNLKNFTGMADFINQNGFYLSQSGLSEKIWQLENETKLALKEQIETGSITLDKTGTVKIYRGVTTGYNPAFIINYKTKNRLIEEDEVNTSIIKPMLQGRNIRKWVYNKTSDFLIFTRKGINIKEFPSIRNYLFDFKEQLEPGSGRKAGNYNWYEIQDNTAYYPEFEKEKIIWGLTSDKWTFAYDNENNFLPSNGYILTSTGLPIKYLLALLNSRLMEFYFGYIGIMTAGGAFTLKYETVIEFPIKNISESKQNIFASLVDFILFLKKQNKDTTFLERLIDAMVYELYLPEEIKAGKAEVLKHLDSLPELVEGQDEQNLETIEKVYNILSAPEHPIATALQNLQNIEAVKIIEGKL